MEYSLSNQIFAITKGVWAVCYGPASIVFPSA